MKEVSSCHLFIEIKYTLVKFLKYLIGSSLVDIVKIENTRSQVEDVDRGSDCEVTWAGKTRHRN